MSLLLLLTGCPSSHTFPDAKRSLEAGWQFYRDGAFDHAESAFAAAERLAPEHGDQRLQALYGMATVKNLRRPGEDPTRAAELYRQITTLDPSGEWSAWSQLALTRMQALVPAGDTPEAASVRAGYQSVVDRYPFQLAGEEAFICQQTALIGTFRPDDARESHAALRVFIATHPDSHFLAAAHELLAACHRVLGEPEKRLAEEISAFEVRESEARRRWEKHPVGLFLYSDSGALFRIANLAEFETGDFDLARRYYRRFLDENPTEKRCFHARQALARMDRVEAEIRASPAPAP